MALQCLHKCMRGDILGVDVKLNAAAGRLEKRVKGWYWRSRKWSAEPGTGVELLDLGQVPFPDRTSPVRRSVQTAIVKQDKPTVAGRLQVELHEVGAELDRFFERW